MKDTRTRLDELFGKAKSRKSVVSLDEARDIISGKHNTVTTDKPKMGGIKMNYLLTAIGTVAAAGIISVATIFNNPNDAGTQNAPVVNEKTDIVAETNINSSNDDNSPVIENQTFVATEDNNAPEPERISEKNIQTQMNRKPVDVKGVNLITLNDNEMKEFGLNIQNGVLNFRFLPVDESDHFMKLTKDDLQVNIGEENDYPLCTPKFITDNKGNRRFSLLTSEDANGYFAMVESDEVQNINIDHDKLNNIDADIDIDIDKTNIFIQDSDNIETSLKIEILDSNFTDNKELLKKLKEEHGIDVDNIMSKSFVSVKVNDSLNARGKMNSQVYVMEGKDIPNFANKIVVDIRQKLMEEMDGAVVISNDSVVQVSEKQIIASFSEKYPTLDSAFDGMGNELTKKIMIDLNDKIFDNNVEMDELIRINKLIPVAIDLDKTDDIEFDYIFWFDPTADIINKLPEDVQARLEPELLALSETSSICEAAAIAGEDSYLDVWRACSGSIENLKVYPNPTSGKVNLNYELIDKRNVTVSLHDMFGNKIKTLQNSAATNMGEINKEFVLDGLEAGMYLIVVQTDKDEQAVQRVILRK